VPRTNYSNAFKTEAVKLAKRGEVSVVLVAHDLGVPYEVLRRWVKEFGTQPNGKAAITPDEHAELIRLRREHRMIKDERDIFKKARGIFSKALSSDTGSARTTVSSSMWRRCAGYCRSRRVGFITG
jgi:transposase